MIDPVAFALAVLALLLTPGPTNTLLAASGATVGMRRSLRLVPCEMAGYGLSILVLILLIGPLVAGHAAFGAALRIAAAAYLASSAVVLWQKAGDRFADAPHPISARRVFMTTLLNPKALVFAFAIFPTLPLPALLPFFAGFFALVAGAGSFWILIGGALARGTGGFATPTRVTRLSAVALGVFATLIAGSAVAAVL